MSCEGGITMVMNVPKGVRKPGVTLKSIHEDYQTPQLWEIEKSTSVMSCNDHMRSCDHVIHEVM